MSRHKTSFLTLVLLAVVVVVAAIFAQKLDKIKYDRPVFDGGGGDSSSLYLLERFDQDNLIGEKWIVSKANKSSSSSGDVVYDGEWRVEPSRQSFFIADQHQSIDTGLVLKSPGKHHAIATRLDKPFRFDQNKPLILQYEVKFQNPVVCGGAYVKLLQENSNLESFHDKSNFSIMFGPDKCGNDRKVHFIVCFKNPQTGEFEEKLVHVNSNSIPRRLFADSATHLFTLVLKPDGSFSLQINRRIVASGDLLNELSPSMTTGVDENQRFDLFKSLSSFDALGLELWSINEDIYFDNFLITDDQEAAERFAQDSWYVKRALEDQAAILIKNSMSDENSLSSSSLLTMFLHAADDSPWLWGLIFLGAFCFSAIFYFACSNPNSSSSSSRFKIKPKNTPIAKRHDHIPSAQGNDHHDETSDDNEQTYLIKRNRTENQ